MANTWTKTVTLPKYSGGVLATYTLQEDVPDKYTSSISGYTITNSYSPETVDILITKQWNDSSNQDGLRPNSLDVKILDGTGATAATVTLTGTGDTWMATATGLPKYSGGKEITYTAMEDFTSSDYTATSSGDMTGGFVFTNSHTPETVNVTVTKIWDDSDDQAGFRPSSINYKILDSNGDVVDSGTLSSE